MKLKGQFRIDDLMEITWNDAAFENLVLPGGEKELAWAFVENRTMSNYAYDDFILNKGTQYLNLWWHLLISNRPCDYYSHVRTTWGWKDVYC